MQSYFKNNSPQGGGEYFLKINLRGPVPCAALTTPQFVYQGKIEST